MWFAATVISLSLVTTSSCLAASCHHVASMLLTLLFESLYQVLTLFTVLEHLVRGWAGECCRGISWQLLKCYSTGCGLYVLTNKILIFNSDVPKAPKPEPPVPETKETSPERNSKKEREKEKEKTRQRSPTRSKSRSRSRSRSPSHSRPRRRHRSRSR